MWYPSGFILPGRWSARSSKQLHHQVTERSIENEIGYVHQPQFNCVNLSGSRHYANQGAGGIHRLCQETKESKYSCFWPV